MPGEHEVRELEEAARPEVDRYAPETWTWLQ